MSETITILTCTDLHQSATLYRQLDQAVERYHPDVVAVIGDFLDAAGGDMPAEQCAVQLASLQCNCLVFTRGNHEDTGWHRFQTAWARTGCPLHYLHGEAFAYGPLVLVAFPCIMGDATPYSVACPLASNDPDVWLAPIMIRHGEPARTLWLMHEPPRGTQLSKSEGVLSGNPEWTDEITRYSPLCVVFGHDHDTPRVSRRWRDQQGSSFLVNVGQRLDGPLHFAVIEATFPSSRTSLPAAMKVTAFPYGQTSEVL